MKSSASAFAHQYGPPATTPTPLITEDQAVANCTAMNAPDEMPDTELSRMSALKPVSRSSVHAGPATIATQPSATVAITVLRNAAGYMTRSCCAEDIEHPWHAGFMPGPTGERRYIGAPPYRLSGEALWRVRCDACVATEVTHFPANRSNRSKSGTKFRHTDFT